jgi:diguanylate cyclase (GGDEF)-like protein
MMIRSGGCQKMLARRLWAHRPAITRGLTLVLALCCCLSALAGEGGTAARIATAAALAAYPLVWLLAATLGSARLGGLSPGRASLDGAAGGLAIGALTTTLVAGPSHQLPTGTALLQLLAMLVTIVGFAIVLALAGWRPSIQLAGLLAGVGLLLVAEGLRLHTHTQQPLVAGGPDPALRLAGGSVIALSPLLPRKPRRGASRGRATTLLACAFAALALGLLIRADHNHVGWLPEALAACALLTAGWRFALSFEDVRRLSEVRERQARTDELTGLANRREFYDRLGAAIDGAHARGTDFALLMIDLDRFKELNDTLGHQAGDQVLGQVGPRMRAVIRGETIARLGGDEFGLILREAAAAPLVAERVRQALGRPFELRDATVSVNASIGIALFPQDGDDSETLLQRADVALYQAKAARSRYSFYTRGDDHNSRERLRMMGELRQAVDQGGLLVHYQPQIELASGSVCGVEALVRWAHPRHGLLDALAFVGLAERCGVMGELTELVLDQALAHQRALLERGEQLRLSVNVASSSLLDHGFLAMLSERLERWGTLAGSLRLEVRETALAGGSAVRLLELLDGLDQLGVGISLDDFGSTGSPLRHLIDLRVQELKIGGEHVRAAAHDERTAIVVANTIALSRELGIDLVAEGVETSSQLQRLRELGCPVAQGHHLCSPLGGKDLDDWLGERPSSEPATATGSGSRPSGGPQPARVAPLRGAPL